MKIEFRHSGFVAACGYEIAVSLREGGVRLSLEIDIDGFICLPTEAEVVQFDKEGQPVSRYFTSLLGLVSGRARISPAPGSEGGWTVDLLAVRR